LGGYRKPILPSSKIWLVGGKEWGNTQMWEIPTKILKTSYYWINCDR